MKKVTELGPNECIHCETQEEFNAILSLNPNNSIEPFRFEQFNEACYNPSAAGGFGAYHSLEHYKEAGFTIHKAKDFLESQLLIRAVEALDDFLNAGNKEERGAAAHKAKQVYSDYYGIPYRNRKDRKVTLNGEELTPEEAINKLKEMV